MLKGITIGSDPELFIYDKKNKKVISSIGLIPGVKGDAFTEGLPSGFGLQIDNILGEFNIPPSDLYDKDAFVGNMNYMKDWISKYVSKINPNYTVKCSASELIDEDQLQTDEAKEFGCSPDFSLYTLEQNPKPEGSITNLRTTGMHIHIGYPKPTINESINMLYYMEAFLGLPSIILDNDTRRRSLYGKAGCFRLTSYGFEYRVLSGYFLKNTELISWVHTQTIKAIESFYRGKNIPVSKNMEEVINNGDVENAKILIQKYNLN